MIINLLISVIISFLSAIFVFLPVVTLATIPYIGSQLSDVLNTAVGIWNAFIVTFPYAGIAWNVFLLVILPFEFLMIIAKFFLGSRVPANNINQ